jgi:very-short-patch-repair endonuclease
VPQPTFLQVSPVAAPPSIDALIAEIARRRYGLITLWQLLALGLTSGAITKRVRAGRLHRVHRGVYAVGHERLSEEGQWMAAVLAAGDGAALSHLSAGVLWKAWRRKVTGIDVIGPARRQVKGVRVHTYRKLDPRDVTVYRGIPVTTVARTLVDLTDVLTEHQLANVIHEAAFRRRFSARATRAAMERANGRTNLERLERALRLNAQGSAGTKSDLEDHFLAHLIEQGHEPPLVNAAVQTPTRQFEVDFVWPDRKLCVEVDGSGHERPRTKKEDHQRDRALKQAGYQVIRLQPPPRPAEDPRPP